MSSVTNTTWKKRERLKARVCAVVISYNTAELTRKSIDALLASKGVLLDVVVIDNASTDRSPVSLARRYRLRKNHELMTNLESKKKDDRLNQLFGNLADDIDQVSNVRSTAVGEHNLHVVELRKNIGFGRANNLASAMLECEYYFYVNSDAFVKPRTAFALTRAFSSTDFVKTSSVLSRTQAVIDNVGIAAAHVFNADKTIQVQGGALPSLPNLFRWITFLDDVPFISRVLTSYQHHESQMRSLRQKKLAKVGWVGGTAIMISRPCLEEIGGFDPHIFMYGEDVELCWRANRRHWDVVLTDAGQVIHLGSASSDHKNAIIGEINGLLYLWYKHSSGFDLWLLRQILRFGIGLRILVFGILRRYGLQRAYQEALALV